MGAYDCGSANGSRRPCSILVWASRFLSRLLKSRGTQSPGCPFPAARRWRKSSGNRSRFPDPSRSHGNRGSGSCGFRDAPEDSRGRDLHIDPGFNLATDFPVFCNQFVGRLRIILQKGGLLSFGANRRELAHRGYPLGY